MGAALTAMLVGARAPGLSGLSRRQGLPAAVDLRHHHRSDRSAALSRRSPGCARAMPTRSPMPGLHAAECSSAGLSRHRAAGRSTRHRRPPTMPRSRSSTSASGASSMRARPLGRAPRGPHRGGGAHADHGLPRRRRDPGAGGARRRAHRRRARPRATARYDFGANAARIRGLMKRSTMRSATQTPEQPPAQPAPRRRRRPSKKERQEASARR